MPSQHGCSTPAEGDLLLIIFGHASCCLPGCAQPAVLKRSALCPGVALRTSCLQAQPAMSTGLQISTCCILVVERQLSRGLCQPHSRDAQLSLQKVLQFWLLLPFPDMPAATSSQASAQKTFERMCSWLLCLPCEQQPWPQSKHCFMPLLHADTAWHACSSDGP